MGDSLTLLDTLVRGVVIGVAMATALRLMNGDASRDVKVSSLLLCFSFCAWEITQSVTVWSALGDTYALVLLAYPLSGLFWLFVLVVFGDRAISPMSLLPAAGLAGAGLVVNLLIPPAAREVTWDVWIAAAGFIMLHAGWMIVRGWGGDLLAGRRRARSLLLVLVSLYGVLEAILVMGGRLHPAGGWIPFTSGRPLGGLIIAAISLGAAALFPQARGALFSDRQRRERSDPRADAADHGDLLRLETLMAAEPWRRERLTIGQLAQDLGMPEHRLRRLINGRLGYRNFADFLNARRVEAAKQRLANPNFARTTVAVIAFDLGYGSLGPFNRAFRAATGATPTEWRRRALAEAVQAD
jgi:AraC-like DNA-binding protein